MSEIKGPGPGPGDRRVSPVSPIRDVRKYMPKADRPFVEERRDTLTLSDEAKKEHRGFPGFESGRGDGNVQHTTIDLTEEQTKRSQKDWKDGTAI